MSDRLPVVLMDEPHVTLATGTMVQPLELFDTITGLDMDQFGKMSGGFPRARRAGLRPALMQIQIVIGRLGRVS